MATLEPNAQTNAPDPLSYTRLFHPIETPKPDTSTATLISGLNQAFDTGITSANKALEEHAEHIGREVGTAEQDQFLSQITSLTPAGDKDNVPGAIKNGLNFVARNEDAYNQGKLRETEYLRNLYEKAKSLRSQWPSYADYIDRGIEKATGITPNANRLISSILQDINDKRSSQDAYQKRVEGDILTLAKEGYPHAAELANDLHAGKIDLPSAIVKMNKMGSIDYQHKVTTADIAKQTLEEGAYRIAQNKASQFVSQQLPELFSSAMSGLTVEIIPGKPEKILDVLRQAKDGQRDDVTDDQMRFMSRMVQNKMIETMDYANKINSKSDVPGGKSVLSLLGDKYQPLLKQGMLPAQTLLDSFTNKENGWAARNAQHVEDAANDSAYRMLNDKDYEGITRVNQAIHKMFGGDAFAVEMNTKILGTPGLFKPDTVSIDRLMKLMATKSAIKGFSEPMTLDKAADIVIKGSADAGGTSNPAAVNAMFRYPPEMISNPTVGPEIKRNIITQSFTPSNNGNLAKIEMDYRDDKTGRLVSGRYGAYGYFTSPAVKKEIDKVSDTFGQPQLKEMYKNWVEYEFTRDLFGQDTTALAELSHQPNMRISMVTTPDGLPQFVLNRVDARGRLTDGSTFPDGVQDVFQRMNGAIQGLGTVHADPEYTKAFVARTMLNAGVHVQDPSVAGSMLRTLVPKAEPKKKDESSANSNK